MDMKRRSPRNFLARAALVVAFVLAFVAVVLNINLMFFVEKAFDKFTSVEAGEIGSNGSDAQVGFDDSGLLLAITIIVLVVLSTLTKSKRKLSRPARNAKPLHDRGTPALR